MTLAPDRFLTSRFEPPLPQSVWKQLIEYYEGFVQNQRDEATDAFELA